MDINKQPTQYHLVYKLESFREKIKETTDKDTIMAIARQAYDLAAPVRIDPTFHYKIQGKEKTLTLLSYEIRSYEKSNSEIEVIQFQLSSTILMLMLQFIQGSLEDIQQILSEFKKVA